MNKQTSFEEFLNQGWSDHATKTAEVADRLTTAFALVESAEQIPRLAQLATHVFGEHLGEWKRGIDVLLQLKTNRHLAGLSALESAGLAAIDRSVAVLEISCGRRASVDDLSLSDQIRILATAASALSEQKDPERARLYFRDAIGKAQLGLQKDDPACRALAVTGNNLACTLAEKISLTESETEFMVLSAQTARKYWEIAGTWLEVERAEYRLSQTYLKANDFANSLIHAQECLEISTANNAPPLEFFFGYEALALAEKARGNTIGFQKAVEQVRINFDKLILEDQSWCEPSLNKLMA